MTCCPWHIYLTDKFIRAVISIVQPWHLRQAVFWRTRLWQYGTLNSFMMSWFEMSLLEVLFLQVKHSQEWVEQERQKTAFLFLSIFRMVCCTLYLCAIITGALRVTWIYGCAFTEHVNNCRQLLHFVGNREHRRLWGKVSQHDLNCSFLCSVIFSDKTFSTLYYFSCFHLFHWKVLVRGEFHWGWQLNLVAQILSRLLFRDSFPLTNVFCLF